MSARLTSILLGTLTAIAMIVLALWCGGNANHIAASYEPARPEITAMSVVAAAVAAVAAAQLVLMAFVVAPLHPRTAYRPFDRVLMLAFAFAAAVAVACSVVFAVVGR